VKKSSQSCQIIFWLYDKRIKNFVLIKKKQIFYPLLKFEKFRIKHSVAKVESAVDPRLQEDSCSNLPQALDNAGDAAPSAFLRVNNMAAFH
jgi:hypothetical protein